jgi:hypothetical protein
LVAEAWPVVLGRGDVACVDLDYGSSQQPRPIDPRRPAREPAGAAGRRRNGAPQIGRVKDGDVGAWVDGVLGAHASSRRDQDADDAGSHHSSIWRDSSKLF